MRCSERWIGLALATIFVVTPTARVTGAPATTQSESCERAERDAASLLAQIRGESEALARRERLLRERAQTAAAAERETARRLEELEALRVAVDERLSRFDAVRDERLGRLAELYGRMPPDRAAAVVGALEPDLAARILVRMRRSRAAALLAALPGARGAELTRRMLSPTSGAQAPPLARAAATRSGLGAAPVP